MILTCPSCSTRYQTDSAHIKAPGRNVRCAKCGHVWFQAAPGIEPELEPEPVLGPVLRDPEPAPDVPAPAPVSERNAESVPIGAVLGAIPKEVVDEAVPMPRRSWGKAIARSISWALFIGLIAGIGWAAVQYRQEIVTLWPQSATVYRWVGLPVNIRGVEITNVSYKQEMEDGQQVLSVTGKVVNSSNREQSVPDISVVLLDAGQHELYQWTFNPGVPTLKPGAESTFVTRLASPPAEARNLNIRFAASKDTR